MHFSCEGFLCNSCQGEKWLGREQSDCKVTAWKMPLFVTVWNTANVLKLTASSQMSGYFHPKLDVAYLVQLQTHFLCAWIVRACVCIDVINVIKTRLAVICKACRCSEHPTSQENLQISITGGYKMPVGIQGHAGQPRQLRSLQAVMRRTIEIRTPY